MIGMIRRYLIGRTRIIAKRQLAQGAKKVVRSVRDKKLLKTKAKSQILAFIVSISLIVPYNANAFGGGEVVFDPTSYAKILESIEKYNAMIKTAQDTLDTMNRINDIMNTANNTLNNLQTGLADPRQLADRFQQNIDSIQATAEAIGKSLERRNWKETFIKKEFASCKKKWQNLMKETKAYAEKQKQIQEKQKYWQEEAEKGIEECKKQGYEAKDCEASEQAYKNALEEDIKEIDGKMATAEKAINQGAQSAINAINNAANEVQAKVDIFNLENKIREVKNPYNYQKNVCQLVEMKQIEWEISKAKKCYFENTAQGNQKEANKCFQKWKKEERNKHDTITKRKQEIWENANGIFNISDDPDKKLMVNTKTGKLEPEKNWKELFGDDFNETRLTQEITYNTPPDKDGNSQKIKVWVASSYAINELFYNKDRPAVALDLQNQRNMAIAMQGDTQAIQKSQLETLQVLNMQISGLNKSINALGNVTNEFLKDHLDRLETALQNTEYNSDRKTIINNESIINKYTENFAKTLDNMGISKFEDTLEYNNAGRLKFKDTKKDNSGIGSLGG